MTRRFLSLALLVAICAALPAVVPAQVESPNAAVLRQRIENQFLARVKQQLGLDEVQSQRMLGVLKESADTRRELEETESSLKSVLHEQLRPGIAADTAAINRALDQLFANRVRYAETFRSEMVDLRAFLTPVQRAQYFQLREQLMQRIQQIIEARRPGNAAGRRRQ